MCERKNPSIGMPVNELLRRFASEFDPGEVNGGSAENRALRVATAELQVVLETLSREVHPRVCADEEEATSLAGSIDLSRENIAKLLLVVLQKEVENLTTILEKTIGEVRHECIDCANFDCSARRVDAPIEEVQVRVEKLTKQNVEISDESDIEQLFVGLQIPQKMITRIANCLGRAHIEKVGQLRERTASELQKEENFGSGLLRYLEEALSKHGISLKSEGLKIDSLSWTPVTYGRLCSFNTRHTKIETLADLTRFTKAELQESGYFPDNALVEVEDMLSAHCLAFKGPSTQRSNQ